MSQPAASTSAATTIYYAQPGGPPAAGDAGPVPAYPPSQLGLPQTVPASSAQYLPRQQPPLTLQPPPIRPRGQSQQAIQQQQQQLQQTLSYQHPAQPPLAQGGATGGGAPSGGVRWEGGQMLDLYIADYCLKRGFAMTAKEIGREAGLGRIEDLAIPINAQQGLLYEWWSVFWEIFQAQNKDQAAGGTTGGPAQDDASVYVQAQQLQAPLGVRQLSVHRPDYAPGGGLPAGGSLDPFYAHQSAAATGRMTPLHPQYQQFQQPQALPVRQSSGGTPLYATAVLGGPGQQLAVQQQQQRYQQQQPPQIQMHSPSPNGLVAGAGGEGGFAYMQIHGHPLQSQPVVLAHQPRPTPPQPNQLQLQQQSQPQPPSVLHNPHHPPPPFAQQQYPQHHPLHPFESLGLRHPIDQETVMFILGNLGLATRAPHTLSPEEKADVQVRYAHMMGQQPPQTQAGIAAMNRLYASGELEEERKQGIHLRDVTASPISQAAVTPVATTAINGAPSKRPRKSPPRGGASSNGRQMYLVPPQTGFAPTPGSPLMAEGGDGASTANGHHPPSAPPAASSGPRSSVKRKASGAAAASPAASSAKAPTPKNPAMPPPPSTPGAGGVAGAHIPSVASVNARSNPPTPKESLIAPSPSSRPGPGPPTPQSHGGGTPAASTSNLQAGSPHPLGGGGSPAAGSPHPGQSQQQQQYFYPGGGGAGGGGSNSTPVVSPATLQAQAQALARQQRQQQQPPTTPAALLDAAGGGGGGGNGFDAFPAEWNVGGGMANGNGHGGGKGGAATNGHHHSPAAMPTPGRGDERSSSSLEHRHHPQLAAPPHPSTGPTAPTPPPLAPAPSTEYTDIDAELAAFDFSAYMADFPDDDLVTGISVIGDEANGGVTERTSGEGGETIGDGGEGQDGGGDKMAIKGDGGKESEI